jgi:hypothetical protein
MIRLVLRRIVVFLVCGTTTIAWVFPARGYEFPVHFGVTMWLAETAGFREGEAYELAKYDQAVDDNPNTEPLWDWNSAGIQSRKQYHFVDGARLGQLRNAALACTPEKMTTPEFIRIGEYFHALEDVYSHRSYGPGLGHGLAGKTPDKPWSNPAGFVVMVEAKFKELRVLVTRCARSLHRESVALGKFRLATGTLNKWKDTEYSFGTSDLDAVSRWDLLLKELFGQRYDIYMVQYPQEYRNWVAEQKTKGWWKP